MYEDVIARLQALGYSPNDTDSALINMTIAYVEALIKNECNISEILEGLRPFAVDMVCGRILFEKKATGQLEGFDVDAAVKSIKEGDTSVTFAIGDAAVTTDALISVLMHAGDAQYATYRRFKW